MTPKIRFGLVLSLTSSFMAQGLRAQATWTQAANPDRRYAASMAHDPVRNETLFFGGADNQVAMNDTWIFDGQDWSRRFPLNQPPARFGHDMAVDASTGNIILFGGWDGSNLYGDTWRWNGRQWAPLRNLAGPSARYGHRMTTDWFTGRVYLFGGQTTGANPQVLNDLWVWDTGQWHQVTPTGNPPIARTEHGLTYVSGQGLLLHGGANYVPLGDTWVFRPTSLTAGTWTEIQTTPSPSPRFQHRLVSDPSGANVFLFGDYGGVDTWQWSRTTSSWSNVSVALGPSARADYVATYDVAAARVLLYGGLASYGGYAFPDRDLWAWDGANWTQPQDVPAPRDHAAMAFDPIDGVVLLHGGHDYTVRSDTWAWNGTRWSRRTQVGPLVSRWGHTLTTCRRTSPPSLIMFGGIDGITGGLSQETLYWGGSAHGFTRLSPATRPPHRIWHAACELPQGEVLIFGGDRGGWYDNDTWRFDGSTWHQMATTNPPSPRRLASMAYDALSGKVLLFGGFDGAFHLQDTWHLDLGTGTWSTLSPSTAPPMREGATLERDPNRGDRLVLVGGSQGTTIGASDRYEWNGTNWRALGATDFPGRQYHRMAHDPARSQLVVFGGSTTGRHLGDTWVTRLQSPAAYASMGPGCGTPAPTLLGVGGALPYIGEPFPIAASGGPTSAGTLAVFLTGFSNTNWYGIPLPFTLPGTGCTLYTSPDLMDPVPAFGGRATLLLPMIPEASLFIGVTFYQQALFATAGTLWSSEGREAVIGVR